jgi:hypothetical protein
MTALLCCRHYALISWKPVGSVHRYENATETTPVPTARRVSEKGAARDPHLQGITPGINLLPRADQKSNIPGYAQNQGHVLIYNQRVSKIKYPVMMYNPRLSSTPFGYITRGYQAIEYLVSIGITEVLKFFEAVK